MSVWAAILAGGSGTRFWPLSTPERPKQLLPLAGDRPLLAQAVNRLAGLVAADRILLITGPALVDRVFHLLGELRARGSTMLIVEQNARRALELADRAYVLRSGEITERGTGAELLARADLFETYLGSHR